MDSFLSDEFGSLALIFFCLILSAFFSSAETSITSLGTLKTKHLLDSLGKRGSSLKYWISHPGRILTTILVYNNVVNILASSITTYLATIYIESGAIGIATGITTFLVLVFGEIIPKSFAKTHAERLAVTAIRFVVIAYYISFPIIVTLSGFADKIVSFFSKNRYKSPLITEEEIEFMVSEGERAGVLKDLKKDIIEGAFEFDETKVKEIMTPRTSLVALSVDTDIKTAIKEAIRTGYSRIPIYKESLDHIVGVVITKDMLNYAYQKKENLLVTHIMRDAFFVPESKSIMNVFKDLKRSKNHLAVLIDEYGGTSGIVSMEDILEEIVGDIQDEHDTEEAQILEVDPGVFEVSGSMSIDDFFDHFRFKNENEISQLKEDDVDTVAGLFTKLVEQMPEVGQTIKIFDLKLEVMEVENKRINLLKVTKEVSKKG